MLSMVAKLSTFSVFFCLVGLFNLLILPGSRDRQRPRTSSATSGSRVPPSQPLAAAYAAAFGGRLPQHTSSAGGRVSPRQPPFVSGRGRIITLQRRRLAAVDFRQPRTSGCVPPCSGDRALEHAYLGSGGRARWPQPLTAAFRSAATTSDRVPPCSCPSP